ncbi:hypothetical protein BRC64_00355 [Halobacteriales archaeon QH_10_67_22]|nr:MAG: hypothetical protein BRC64_00355 [Halobacteriales archaeon QH_10_67_22]
MWETCEAATSGVRYRRRRGRDEPVVVTVETEVGEPVGGANVTVESGTLALSEPQRLGTTDADGTARGHIDATDVNFRPGQREGTLTVAVEPPADAGTAYRDGASNAELVVVAS